MTIDFKALDVQLDEKQAAAVAAALQALIDERVTGLANKNTELLGKLSKSNEALTLFEGIDPEKARVAEKEKQDAIEARLLAEGKNVEFAELKAQQTRDEMTLLLDAERSGREKDRAILEQYRSKAFESEIQSAAIKGGIDKFAVPDAVLRAKSVFSKNEKGDYVAIDANGDLMYGEDGKTPLALLDWIESLRPTAPHLFGESESAGTLGNFGETSAKSNPWHKDSFNRTEQAKIMKADSTKAERLKRAAGNL